jgi:23S rRNA (pseudouridine1915-N3)-methyltransferase
MRIVVAAVGRWKRDPTRALFDAYRQRCRWPIELKEVVARKGGDAPDVQADESAQLLAAVPDGAPLIALDARGRALTSGAFADWLAARRDDGDRTIAAAIGGADGLTDAVRQRADLTLALGAMTWPHMLVRVMLAEQLYRAQCILDGHPYHR